MPDPNVPQMMQSGFGGMVDAALKSPTATKVKAVASKPPDVSQYSAGSFVADPKNPGDWRLDPKTKKPVALKGPGFLGALKVPGTNDVATEYSVGVNIGGKEMDVPSLVPTLTSDEVKQTLDAAAKGEQPPWSVIDKATAHAKERISAGKSPFAGPEDTLQ